MRAAAWLANVLIGAVVLIACLYFVISLCVTFFKLTGQIVEGQPMYFDLRTPTWVGLLIFQSICVAILGVGFYLRSKLRGRSEQLR